MKKIFIKFFLIVAISFSGVHQMIAQNSIDKAWEYFIQNKTELSRAEFLKALPNSATAEEANLGLSILATIDKTDKEAFQYFSQFYAASKNPSPYLEALWTTGSGFSTVLLTKEQIKLLESILLRPDQDGTLRTIALSKLAAHYDFIANSGTAEKYYAQIGNITEWSTVGEFDNISGGGFDKNWDPIKHPEASYVFKNRVNADVKWFDIKNLQPGRWCYMDHSYNNNNAVIFAQTFCKSTSDMDVQLRIGTSGSIKAWVNDVLVINEKKERNNDADTYIAKIKLKKGNNRVLIQLGDSELDNMNFLARITDNKGINIPNLVFTSKFQEYSKETFKPEAVGDFSEEYFEAKIKEEPTKILNYILVANAYLRNEKSYEARKAIEKARKFAPDCSYIRWLLMQVYIKENNRTGLSLELENLKSKDPDSDLALEFLYSDAFEREDYVKSKELLAKISAKPEKEENVMLKEIQLASAEKRIEDMFKIIEDGYKKYPDNYSFVYYKFLVEKNARKNTSSAMAVIKKYLKKYYSTSALGELYSLYIDLGNAVESINILDGLIKHSPRSVGYYAKLANLNFQMSNYDKSSELFKNCLELAPYIGVYHSDLGQCLEETGKKSEAIEKYKTCLTYNPNSYDTRRKMRKLEGKKEVFEYFTEPDYLKMYKDAPDATAYPEDNSLIVLDEVQKVVYANGGSEEKHYMLVKVYNAAGRDDWKEYSIGYSNNQSLLIEKAEVLKKDGNKIKAEINDNDIVFTNLEEGDAIYMAYKIEVYQYGKLARHFWDTHYFKLFYPYQTSRYSLLIEPSVKFDYKLANGTLEPTKTTVDEFNKYVWERKDVASVKHEAYMPSLTEMTEVLHLSTFPDWDYVSKWYSDLSKTKAKSDFEVKELTSSLFEGKEKLNQYDKAKIIYNWIVKNIRYSSVSFRQSALIPQKAADVINTKMGDCKDVSTLFVAMCNEVGIESSLVLVNTRDNGTKEMMLPSINFNHCIAKSILDGKEYYIELTSDFNSMSAFGQSLKNSFSLDITENPEIKVSPKTLNPSTRKQNIVSRNSTVKFEGQKMLVSKKSFKTAASATSIRSTYRDLGKDAQEKEMQQNINADYPNIKLTKLKFDSNLSTTEDTVSYTHEYTVNNVFAKVGEMDLLKIPFADYQEPVDFMSMEKREYPIDLWRYTGYDKEYEVLNIQIPDGKKLAETPKNILIKCPYANYSLSFKINGKNLIVTREFNLINDVVPVEGYNEFKDFFEKMITADRTQIGFKKIQ